MLPCNEVTVLKTRAVSIAFVHVEKTQARALVPELRAMLLRQPLFY
jgi:hypothetical protein